MPQFATKHTREELEFASGIYKISLRGTPRVYIGQSRNIWKRMRSHINDSTGKHKGCRKTRISYSLAKYGVEAFDFAVVAFCDAGSLDDLEDFFIKMFNSVEGGFNILKTPIPISIPAGVTAETRRKLSEAAKGRKRTEETKARMRESALRKPPMTSETLAKLSAAHKGFKQSEEQKEKTRQRQLGKKLPPEWRANLKKGAQRRARAVEQFDMMGNLVARHPSVSLAAVSADRGVGNLCAHLQGRVKTCGGFIWKYAPALAN